MGEQECDQIFRIPADGSGEPVLVSTGEGRTTCAYFTYPEGDRVLYATTHLADPACPPPPDRSQGYVWALYDSFDIVSAALDGSDLRRLTDEPGYDAEATVCPVDGRVIFLSNLSSAGGREFDLWAVDTDGTDLERITWAEEFDGFPLFSPDGKRLAFASNRHHAREGETNLFVARWQGGGAPAEEGPLTRDVLFVAFSGEETGLLGSTTFVRNPPGGLDLERSLAMINLDMVGRLREKLTVLGDDSAAEWQGIVRPRCQELDLPCAFGGDAYGPSDHTAFYAAGVPVLYLFTGAHDDYHKPSDDPAGIHAAGGARIARLTAEVAAELARRPEPLTYRETTGPAPRGDVRSYGASLGVIPDYAGEEGVTGMLLAGVRPEGPADRAGIRRDDLLVHLAGTEIRDVHDLVYVLRQAKPGQTVKAVVVRDGERLELEVTFGESQRPRG